MLNDILSLYAFLYIIKSSDSSMRVSFFPVPFFPPLFSRSWSGWSCFLEHHSHMCHKNIRGMEECCFAKNLATAHLKKINIITGLSTNLSFSHRQGIAFQPRFKNCAMSCPRRHVAFLFSPPILQRLLSLQIFCLQIDLSSTSVEKNRDRVGQSILSWEEEGGEFHFPRP